MNKATRESLEMAIFLSVKFKPGSVRYPLMFLVPGIEKQTMSEALFVSSPL
jgi:hypothetical protein